MTNQEPETHKKTAGREAEAGVKEGRRKGEEGEAVGSGVLGRAEAGKRKKAGSAKGRKKGPEGSPVEDVTMTAEEEKELKRWLAVKVRDPNFKRLSATKLNHEGIATRLRSLPSRIRGE